ncbi:Mitochondria Localisation Sequence [Pristimantis euphronides]
MHLCRSAWQKLVPLTQRGAAALLRPASARQMSSSSVPGSTGGALPYYILVGVALTGGGYYAYYTVGKDRERSKDRHEYINSQLKPAFEEYGNNFSCVIRLPIQPMAIHTFPKSRSTGGFLKKKTKNKTQYTHVARTAQGKTFKLVSVAHNIAKCLIASHLTLRRSAISAEISLTE